MFNTKEVMIYMFMQIDIFGSLHFFKLDFQMGIIESKVTDCFWLLKHCQIVFQNNYTNLRSCNNDAGEYYFHCTHQISECIFKSVPYYKFDLWLYHKQQIYFNDTKTINQYFHFYNFTVTQKLASTKNRSLFLLQIRQDTG